MRWWRTGCRLGKPGGMTPPGNVNRPTLSTPRPDETAPASEMAMARGWLDHLRGSVLFKIEGLTPEQLRWAPTPTANSLGVIVVHLGLAERQWFREVFAGEAVESEDVPAPFSLPEGWGVEEVAAFYRDQVARADAVMDEEPSFDAPSRDRSGRRRSGGS